MTNDHRDHARDLDLFHIQEDSPGLIFWHPNGWRLFRTIESYMREQHTKYGYEEVRTPILAPRSLWETSGHWEKFRENMFVTGDLRYVENDGDEVVAESSYGLKPMSCPSQIQIYKHSRRSYRELPMRLMEFGQVFRNETSGSLSGMMRLRNFTQDDSHIFVLKEHVLSEAKNYIKMLREVYAHFGFTDVTVKLSTRPEKRAGSDEIWDTAERMLGEACDTMDMPYELSPGEGAFYGPKLEFTLQDALGRGWQCGTFQLDFVLPKRFDLSYQNNNGEMVHSETSDDQVVLIHHAVLGSLERFIGILLESTEGRLPAWLAPIQVVVCPISEKSEDWAFHIGSILQQANIRLEIDTSGDKIGNKIRTHSLRKIPFLVIIGEQERDSKMVNIRPLGGTPFNTDIDGMKLAILSNGEIQVKLGQNPM